jgi:hypothetical protein
MLSLSGPAVAPSTRFHSPGLNRIEPPLILVPPAMKPPCMLASVPASISWLMMVLTAAPRFSVSVPKPMS